MRKAYKYRIYLTNGQQRLLERQLEECRWVYNETLAERKRAYEERGESLRLYDTQAMLPGWKLTRPALRQVHSQVLQNVQVRVDLAFKSFFRRVREGADAPGFPHVREGTDVPGFPRFKGKGRYDSITYPQYGNGVRLDGTRLILSKVGAVEVVLHRPVEGTPKTVTLSRSRTGKWFVSFSCEVEANELHPTSEVVGVDVGLASFATFSTGEKIDNPRFYRRDEADPKRVQRRKAEEAGRSVILVNPRNTSRMCSSCGELVVKTLSDRTHSCPTCGLVMDRDVNAAINILHRGLHTLQT